MISFFSCKILQKKKKKNYFTVSFITGLKVLHYSQSVLHLVVWYSGPGQHTNTNTTNTVTTTGTDQQLESSLEEDSQALINLERNIANLERSLSASQLLQTV